MWNIGIYSLFTTTGVVSPQVQRTSGAIDQLDSSASSTSADSTSNSDEESEGSSSSTGGSTEALERVPKRSRATKGTASRTRLRTETEVDSASDSDSSDDSIEIVKDFSIRTDSAKKRISDGWQCKKCTFKHLLQGQQMFLTCYVCASPREEGMRFFD